MIAAEERKRIVIVDGYTTGWDIARELLERNVECFHLRSSKEFPPIARSFNAALFPVNLGYLGEATETADMLRLLRPDAVIAGSDCGVAFAEHVADSLGLPTNRRETVAARRDKCAMMEVVRTEGLLTPVQVPAWNMAEAHAWAERHAKWPIVVKPAASSRADGVRICYTPADVARAFERSLHKINLLGTFNDRLLVQSFVSGRQFIVNTVSVDGQHYVTDAWRMNMCPLSRNVIVPKELQLVDLRRDNNGPALVRYTLDVLASLGIENGAAQTDIKCTRDGPVLIECGAHLMATSMDRRAYREAELPTQARVLADSLTLPRTEWRSRYAAEHYRFRNHMTQAFFSFDEEGVVRGVRGLARLRKLPSFQAHDRPLSVDDRVSRTAGLQAVGGIVHLVHEDAEQIANDLLTLREWESGGELYDIALRNDTPDMLIPRALSMKLARAG